MSWFWIIGIVANVTLTVLAIVWVLRQGKPRSEQVVTEEPLQQTTEKKPGGPSSAVPE